MKYFLPKQKSLLKKATYLLKSLSILILINVFSTNLAYSQDTINVIMNNGNNGFKIDGKLRANVPGDWIPAHLDSTGGGGYAIKNDGEPVDSLTSIHIRELYDSGSDFIFTSGSKFNGDPNGWSWATSKASAKTDIENVLFHYAEDDTGAQWIFISGDRLSTTGTSYFDFEFNQECIIRHPDPDSAVFISEGLDGGRTVGDFVVSMEYTSGGTNAVVTYWVWESVGSGYDFVEKTIPPNYVSAYSNDFTEEVPYGAFGSNSYQPLSFVEAGVNISGILEKVEPCAGLKIKSILGKTKSSDAKTAALKDFVEPIQVDLAFGTAEITYDDTLCTADGTATPKHIGIKGGTYANSSGLTIHSGTGLITYDV